MAERTPGHSLDVLFIADHAPPSISGRASILREVLVRQPREKTILLAPRTAGAKAFDRGARLDARRWASFPLLGEAGTRWLRRRHLRWIITQRRPQMVVAFGTGAEAAMALETRRATGAAVLLHLERPELFAARVALREGGARGRAVRELFDCYVQRPGEMQAGFAARSDIHRAVADYIAGMTDRYALREHERLTGRKLLDTSA